jgi:hypothetical protein
MIFMSGKREKQPKVNASLKVKGKGVWERRIGRKHSRHPGLPGKQA